MNRLRGQAGLTVVELLLVVMISAMILGPLFSWALLAIDQQRVTKDGFLRTASAGLVSSYFPHDVAVAGAAWVPGVDFSGPGGAEAEAEWNALNREDCVGGEGANGRPLLVLWSGGANAIKTIYSVAPTPGGNSNDGETIWRRECNADTGELMRSTGLFDRTDPDATRTRATCSSEATDLPCRQVQLVINPTTEHRAVQLVGMRRTDAESLREDSQGNQIPTVAIEILSLVRTPGTQHHTAVLAAVAHDADGEVVEYEWSLPNGPEGPNAPPQTVVAGESMTQVTHEFPRSGVYSVRVSVTDDDGAVRATYRKVTIENLAPVPVIDITPATAIAGTEVVLNGSGSHDPDGTLISHTWNLTEQNPPEGAAETVPVFSAEFTGELVPLVVPEWATGQILVTLTVVDNDGASRSAVSTLTVVDPTAPDPEDPDPDPEDPDPEPGMPPVAVLVATQGATSLEWTLNGSGSRHDPEAGPLTYEWRVNGNVIAGTTAIVNHTFAAAGTYTIMLTVTDTNNLSHSTSRSIQVTTAPVQVGAPTNVRVDTATGRLYWDHRQGARRYLVDFRSVGNGCQRTQTGIAVSPTINYRALPPNPCPAGSTPAARVGAEFTQGGQVHYSAWVNLGEVSK